MNTQRQAVNYLHVSKSFCSQEWASYDKSGPSTYVYLYAWWGWGWVGRVVGVALVRRTSEKHTTGRRSSPSGVCGGCPSRRTGCRNCKAAWFVPLGVKSIQPCVVCCTGHACHVFITCLSVCQSSYQLKYLPKRMIASPF